MKAISSQLDEPISNNTKLYPCIGWAIISSMECTVIQGDPFDVSWIFTDKAPAEMSGWPSSLRHLYNPYYQTGYCLVAGLQTNPQLHFKNRCVLSERALEMQIIFEGGTEDY